MEQLATIRLGLGINAQKMVQQVQLNNKIIEDQIEKGIQLALDDITKDDNFVEIIREQTKKELHDIIRKTTMSYEVRSKISKAVEEKLGERIDMFADKIADKISETLN